ncbi:MAG: ornithine cyclodeaminase, partial [Propionibacteriaceae bacterium]|nr:ornithine cyclodeaminase [Propionibacteriaceae bacterium]
GLGFEVRVADDGAEAVRGADIVTTCTADKARATVLFDASVEPGMHLNAIGGDCPGKTELEPSILGRAGVFVEHTPQTRIEGEIQLQAPDFPVTELWTVIAGAAAGRQDTEQVTIFDSVGFAVEDFTALSYVHQRAAATGYATEIDLVADPDDPKDLFALIAGSRG